MEKNLQTVLNAARIEAVEKAQAMLKDIGNTKDLRDIAVVLMDLDPRDSWHGVDDEPESDQESKDG